MKNKRVLSSAMAVVMTLSTFVPAMAATPTLEKNDIRQQLMQSVTESEREYNILQEARLLEKKGTDKVRVIVELKEKPVIDYAIAQGVRLEDMNEEKAETIETALENSMKVVENKIKKENIDAKILYKFVNVFNGFSATMTVADMEKVREISNVKSVVISTEYERPELPTPDMNTSVDIISANPTWDLSLKGAGMVVAVMDSSFAPDHPSMQTMTRPNKAKIKSQSEIPSDLPGTFRTLKMPYAWNYYDNTANLASSSDHGTHVSGTVGASGDPEKGQVRGVAPEAQILGMKVFGDDPSISTTYDDIYVRAIEDAIKLGADVVNMSLGSTASFLQDEANDPARIAIKKASESGIVVNVSAGNSNRFGSGFADSYTSDPDVGVVGSPSLNPETLSIASVENTHVAAPQIETNAGKFGYMQSGKIDITAAFNGDSKEYVYCGIGNPSDFVGKNLAGKVALIQRGSIGFGLKVLNAQMTSAAAVVVFNSAAGGDALMGMSYGDQDAQITIPAAFVGMNDGLKMKNATDKKVKFTTDMTSVKNVSAGRMSNFTSWGVTPNLDFKPELTAPGGQIYSTLQNGKYGLMSGTSMASPHAAGGSALILQRIDEEFGLKGKARFELAKNLMMTTAVPLVDDVALYGELVSPRRQGAGVMNLYAAATSNVVVVDPSTNLSKINLKEISNPQVSYDVEIKNFGAQTITYNLSSSVATDAVKEGRLLNNSQPIKGVAVKFTKDGVDVSNVIVTTGSSVRLTVSMDLSNMTAASLDEDGNETQKAFTELFPNGGFVEGFLRLTDANENAPSIGLPYMGFYGDWNKPSIIDVSLYDATPEKSQFYGAGYNGLYTETPPVAPSTTPGSPFIGFSYDGKANKELIAISPNGDGYGDYMGSYFTFLRNAKELEVNILDKDGNNVRELYKDSNLRKNYFDGDAKNPKGKDFGTWDGMVNNEVVEGLYTYEVKTKIDFPNAPWQVSKYPVMIDNTAPVIESIVYNKEAQTITVKAMDNFKVKNYALFVNGKMITNPDAKGKDQPNDNMSGVFDVTGKVTQNTEVKAYALDYSYNAGEKSAVVDQPVIVIVDDKKAPVIDMKTPAALEFVNTNEVVFTGTVVDPTGLKSIVIGGQAVDFTYDETAKTYKFTKMLTLPDGKHGVKVTATDLAGNTYTFERKIYVDGTAPKVVFKPEIMKVVANEVAKYTLTGTFSDNYSGVALTINGNMLGKIAADENVVVPKEMSKAFSVALPLKEGDNIITVQAVDGAGNKLTQAYTVYRLKKGEVNNMINATITQTKVSSENPASILLTANTTTIWDVTIVDPLGVDVIKYKETGLKLQKTWTPEIGRKLNGEYKVVVNYTQFGTKKTALYKLNVYNYPLIINNVSVVKRSGAISVEADIASLSKLVQNPMLVVQVTNDKGQVVNISTAKIKNLQASQEVTLTSGFGTPNTGVYNVEVFVWTGWDDAKSLAGKATQKFIVE